MADRPGGDLLRDSRMFSIRRSGYIAGGLYPGRVPPDQWVRGRIDPKIRGVSCPRSREPVFRLLRQRRQRKGPSPKAQGQETPRYSSGPRLGNRLERRNTPFPRRPPIPIDVRGLFGNRPVGVSGRNAKPTTTTSSCRTDFAKTRTSPPRVPGNPVIVPLACFPRAREADGPFPWRVGRGDVRVCSLAPPCSESRIASPPAPARNVG